MAAQPLQKEEEEKKRQRKKEDEEEARQRKKEDQEEQEKKRQKEKKERWQEKEEEEREKKKQQKEEEEARKRGSVWPHGFGPSDLRATQVAPSFGMMPFEGIPNPGVVTPYAYQQAPYWLMQAFMRQQQQQDHTALPALPPNAPAMAPSSTFPATRRSSPISTILSDREILKRFFESKARGQDAEGQEKIARVRRIVDDQDWTVTDLKEMKDRKSETYRLAVAAGISDGFARSFARNLRAFKMAHRQEEEAAQMLAHAGGKYM